MSTAPETPKIMEGGRRNPGGKPELTTELSAPAGGTVVHSTESDTQA